MTLLSNETLWIFLLASSDNLEVRHIHDISNGVCQLENKGIKPENIRLLIDENRQKISKYLDLRIKSDSYVITQSINLKTIVEESSHKNIVVFVTGHGYFENGIDAPSPIKPYDLLDSLRCNKLTENIIIYLGQCYAGIFNYVDVSKEPNTVIIGATNLYPSISCPIENCDWHANLFLYNVFKWISHPIDIDGDGKYTVMDSYKYAGAKTNNYCYQYKGESLQKILQLLEEKRILLNKPNNIENQLKLKELNKVLLYEQLVHYNNQEPWILNAFPAQDIKF